MEFKIVKFFNSRFGFFDPAVKVVGRGSLMVAFLTFLVVLSWVLDAENGTKVLLAASLASVLHFAVDDGLLEHFYKRLRPYLAYPKDIFPIGFAYKDFSFPSCHVSGMLAVFTVFFHFYPQFWPLMVVFALFVVWSRMRSGMHYPSDVLAGVVLGIVYGMIALAIIT